MRRGIDSTIYLVFRLLTCTMDGTRWEVNRPHRSLRALIVPVTILNTYIAGEFGKVR